jgi:hypothetical protein
VKRLTGCARSWRGRRLKRPRGRKLKERLTKKGRSSSARRRNGLVRRKKRK